MNRDREICCKLAVIFSALIFNNLQEPPLSPEYRRVACLWTEQTAENVYRRTADGKGCEGCEMVGDRNVLANATNNRLTSSSDHGMKTPRSVVELLNFNMFTSRALGEQFLRGL